jgi:hypothetical protein
VLELCCVRERIEFCLYVFDVVHLVVLINDYIDPKCTDLTTLKLRKGSSLIFSIPL